jgi:hypothetical protein
MERDTAKPIPMPFSFVVIKASKIWSGSSTPGPLSITWINIPFESVTARSTTSGATCCPGHLEIENEAGARVSAGKMKEVLSRREELHAFAVCP